MIHLLIAAVASTLLVMSLRHAQRSIKRGRMRRVRTHQSLEQIWCCDIAATGLQADRFHEAWLRLARTFGVAPEQIRLSDRFDHELRHLDHLLDGWLLRVMVAAETGASAAELARIRTVRDYVLLASRPLVSERSLLPMLGKTR